MQPVVRIATPIARNTNGVSLDIGYLLYLCVVVLINKCKTGTLGTGQDEPRDDV